MQSTIAGNDFIQQPLKNSLEHKMISLPGIGEANCKKLKKFGYINEMQLLGLYMSFNFDDEMFIDFLEKEVGVEFVANKYGKVEEYKQKLCYTLKSKWDIIKNY